MKPLYDERFMRLMTFRYAGKDHAGVLAAEGLVPILEINTKHDLHLPNSLLEIIENEIRDIPVRGVSPLPLSEVEPRLPYSFPPKIWCIGLNYKTHAEDINAAQPRNQAVS
jgi:2-keto-4-pentenoate hydratase/2-oxohepta-3-ene-1,7-dioic acid hydratase in catechol pathway